jgi:hypothetical protein
MSESAFAAPYGLLRQVRYLLATKRSLRHRTSYRPDKHRHTVNKLRTRGGAFIREYCGGVCAEVNFIPFEFVHRRLVLEHNKLTVVLKSGLKPGRHLGQVRVTDVLAFLLDNTPTVSPTHEQAAFGDLREESVAVTLLGKASNCGSVLFHSCLEA